MTQTATAPMGARQINSNLYVGQGDLANIQKAVSAAVRMGGGYAVIVPPGYGWGDNIEAVTGGVGSVYIIDQRATSPQSYFWTGSQYVPAAFVQLGGYAADFAGGNPTIPMEGNLELDGVFACIANSFGGAGATQEGFALTCNVSNGNSETDFINATNAAEVGGGYHWYNGVAPYSVDEDTNPLMVLDGGGNLSVSAAHFDSCFVNGAPVLTEASPIGMIYPDPGISVSEGDAWGPSINPASLAPYPPAGIALSTGTAWGASINPASLVPYPPAGLAVSTGTAWGTSIGTTNIALLNVANTFTANQTINGTLSVENIFFGTLLSAYGTNPYFITNNNDMAISAGPGGNLILNYFASGGTASIQFGNGNRGVAGSIDASGDLSVNGTIRSQSSISAFGSNPAQNAMNLEYSTSGGWGRVLAESAAGSATAPDFILVSLSGDGSSYNEVLHYKGASHEVNIQAPLGVDSQIVIAGNTTVNYGTSSIQANPGNITVNAGSGGGVWFNYVGGGALVNFANGAGAVIASVDNAGNAHFNGNLTAGTKTFRIPHPIDKSKDLIHGCLEGPEHAVFYRGEGECIDGMAEVVLPDYFEALTEPEGRTVTLTHRVNDADRVFGGSLAAGRVRDGKFNVYATEHSAMFYWEVRAVRANAPIKVVSDRQEKAA